MGGTIARVVTILLFLICLGVYKFVYLGVGYDYYQVTGLIVVLSGTITIWIIILIQLKFFDAGGWIDNGSRLDPKGYVKNLEKFRIKRRAKRTKQLRMRLEDLRQQHNAIEHAEL